MAGFHLTSKKADDDLDCIDACFGSVMNIDSDILGSAIDPDGGVWDVTWDVLHVSWSSPSSDFPGRFPSKT